MKKYFVLLLILFSLLFSKNLISQPIYTVLPESMVAGHIKTNVRTYYHLPNIIYVNNNDKYIVDYTTNDYIAGLYKKEKGVWVLMRDLANLNELKALHYSGNTLNSNNSVLSVGDTNSILATTGRLNSTVSSATSGHHKNWTVDIQSGAWTLDPVNPPEHLSYTNTATNKWYIEVDFFDDTATNESLLAQIQLPDDINTNGNVYFTVYGFAKTIDTNEIQLAFYSAATRVGVTYNTYWTQSKSGDYTTVGPQDILDKIQWNKTVSSLGWHYGDMVRIKLCRTAITDGIGVTGDYGIIHTRIEINRR